MRKPIVIAIWGVIGLGVASAAIASWSHDARRESVAEALAAIEGAYAHAAGLQERAAIANHEAAEARRNARRENTAESISIATRATQMEREAHTAAADAWENLGETIEPVLRLDLDRSALNELRLLSNRARIGTGNLAGAADDLERMLEDDANGPLDPPLRVRAREELANAYYIAARHMRLRAYPESQWRLVSDRARQHARVLAEGGNSGTGELAGTIRHQRNLEVIMEFERTPIDVLEAEALPDNCPGGNCRNMDLDSWPWERRKPRPKSPEDDRNMSTNSLNDFGGGS